jgi:hypothetical protein
MWSTYLRTETWNDLKGQSKGQIYNSKTNCDGF